MQRYFDLRYYAEYNCVFKLHNFPFDVQVCEMVFKLRTATKNYVELRDGGLKYKGDKNLVEFEVYNISTSAGTATIIIILDLLNRNHMSYDEITDINLVIMNI